MTWMTRMSIFDSAEDLALPQLAQAQLHSESLFNELVFGEANEEVGSAPLPLVRMWIGYEAALAAYSVACATLMVSHGVSTGIRSLELANTIKELRRGDDPVPYEAPTWFQDVDVLSSHRSNLMRRWPDSYNFPRIPKDMPYLWPIVDDQGGYVLKLSKYDRGLLESGERKLATRVMERIQS